MRKAKISELKAHLSSYLAGVRNGDTLIVCERATPIALLVPFDKEAEDFKIRESSKPISELGQIRPFHLRKRVDVNKILQEIRGDR